MQQKLTGDGEHLSLISSDLSFKQRQEELMKFLIGNNKVLLTTDVSARGLDVNEVKVVINYDLPLSADKKPNMKLFLARITRAGRLQKGAAITLLDSSSISNYQHISKYFGFNPEQI